jgi:hypothetical protein
VNHNPVQNGELNVDDISSISGRPIGNPCNVQGEIGNNPYLIFEWQLRLATLSLSPNVNCPLRCALIVLRDVVAAVSNQGVIVCDTIAEALSTTFFKSSMALIVEKERLSWCYSKN